MTANEYGVSFWKDKNVLKLTVMIIAQLCEILKTIELYPLILLYVNYIPVVTFLKKTRTPGFKFRGKEQPIIFKMCGECKGGKA